MLDICIYAALFLVGWGVGCLTTFLVIDNRVLMRLWISKRDAEDELPGYCYKINRLEFYKDLDKLTKVKRGMVNIKTVADISESIVGTE